MPVFTNSKFYIKDVTFDLGIPKALKGILKGVSPGFYLKSYFMKNASNVFLPNITFETKEIKNTEEVERIPFGIKYTDLVIDLDMLEFRPQLIQNITPVNIEIALFQRGEQSINPLIGDDHEIIFNIKGCHLKDHIIGDFNHAENKINKVRLIYQPSYVEMEVT